MRVKFRKGEQRKFLKRVLGNLMSVSLRSLRQYGVEVNYSTLKSYYNENRTLPTDLFDDLCKISGLDSGKIKFELLDENWGKVKGGKR
jgi:hypothetical protein